MVSILVGRIFMSLVFYMFHVLEHSEHVCLFVFVEEDQLFSRMGGTPSPPLAENSVKIIHLIFQPFP